MMNKSVAIFRSSWTFNVENINNIPLCNIGTTNGADTVGLLEGENRKQVNYNFWSLSFYGQFFDVDTEDVRKR